MAAAVDEVFAKVHQEVVIQRREDAALEVSDAHALVRLLENALVAVDRHYLLQAVAQRLEDPQAKLQLEDVGDAHALELGYHVVQDFAQMAFSVYI